MKLTRNDKKSAGITLALSAATLTSIFALCCTGKNFRKNKPYAICLLAVALTEAAASAYLLLNTKKPDSAPLFKIFDSDKYEIFDDDNATQARKIILAELHNKQDAEGDGEAAVPKYEIPLDTEATEDDYAG